LGYAGFVSQYVYMKQHPIIKQANIVDCSAKLHLYRAK